MITRSSLTLFFVSFVWGVAFIFQRMGMEFMGPYFFNGLRFGLGALLVALLVCASAIYSRRRIQLPAGIFRHALMLGSVLFIGAALQQLGMVYTTAAKGGFLTGLYVVMVPLLGLFLGQRVKALGITGIILAVIGSYLLMVNERFEVNRGDVFVVIAAVMWGVQVQLIARVSRMYDPLVFAAIQFSVCSLFSFVLAALLEPVTLESVYNARWAIAYGGGVSIGLGYTLQLVAQRSAHPSYAALIMSLEAVFAALAGVIVLGETFTDRALLGAALMLGGVMLSQLDTLPHPEDAHAARTPT